MSASTRLGLATLTLAILLGLLADWLLRSTPLGLGAALWLLAALAASAVLAWRSGRLQGAVAVGLAVAPLYALLLCWRDSPVLAELNIFGLVVCLSLGLLPEGRLAWAHADELVYAGLVWFGGIIAGLLPVLGRDVEWRGLLGRGLVRALPPLLALGLAAGAVAARPHHLGAQVATIVIWAWVAGGTLRVAATAPGARTARSDGSGRLGAAKVALVLGVADLLLLAFVVLERRTLAGGSSFVLHHTHLTYAGHARSGFLELLALSVLALGLLLWVESALRRESRAAELAYRVLGAGLVLLVLAVLASAVRRTWLYDRTFGLTGLRFYALAFMLWLAVVLAWSLPTLLLHRRARFGAGALFSGLAAIVVLNAVNPDAVIARVDVHRARHAKIVDYDYLRTLSDDATPTLLAALPELARIEQGAGPTTGPTSPQRTRAATQQEVRRLLDLHARCSADWRTWSWSRARARDLLCKR